MFLLDNILLKSIFCEDFRRKDEGMNTHSQRSRTAYKTRRPLTVSAKRWLLSCAVVLVLLIVGYQVFSANNETELRSPVEDLAGGLILTVDASRFIVKRSDGSCIDLLRKSQRYAWYIKTDCPNS
jgi:hypothetical protein